MGNLVPSINTDIDIVLISKENKSEEEVNIYEPLRDFSLFINPEDYEEEILNNPSSKYREFLNIYKLKFINDVYFDYIQEGFTGNSVHIDTMSDYMYTTLVSSLNNPSIEVKILIEIRKNSFFLYYEYPYKGAIIKEGSRVPPKQFTKYSSTFWRREDNDVSKTPINLCMQVKYSNILIEDFIQSKFNNKPSKYII